MYAWLTIELAALLRHEPEVIATIWDPDACPASLLPWLAYALSVDVWDSSWSEARKRAVIAASPMVHRLKGTLASVENALTAMGLSATLTEWWETDPIGQRGTFDITIHYPEEAAEDEVLISEKQVTQSLQSVRATKPKSRTFDYRVLLPFEQEFGLAGVTSVAVPLVINGLRDKTITLDCPFGLPGSTMVAGLLAIEGEQDLTIVAKADLATAGAVSVSGVLTIEGIPLGFTSNLLGEDGAPLLGSDGAQLYGYN